MEIRDVFFFDSMLTPKIITIVYWLALFAAIVGGIGTMFTANFFAGAGILVAGVLGARIWCELLIVMFKIYESIKKLADK